MKYKILISVFVLSACSNTGIVKLDKDTYMVSEKNAKVGFVTADEEKATVYKQANEFCSKKNMDVVTLNLQMQPSGLWQQARATLEFRCVKR